VVEWGNHYNQQGQWYPQSLGAFSHRQYAFLRLTNEHTTGMDASVNRVHVVAGSSVVLNAMGSSKTLMSMQVNHDNLPEVLGTGTRMVKAVCARNEEVACALDSLGKMSTSSSCPSEPGSNGDGICGVFVQRTVWNMANSLFFAGKDDHIKEGLATAALGNIHGATSSSMTSAGSVSKIRDMQIVNADGSTSLVGTNPDLSSDAWATLYIRLLSGSRSTVEVLRSIMAVSSVNVLANTLHLSWAYDDNYPQLKNIRHLTENPGVLCQQKLPTRKMVTSKVHRGLMQMSSVSLSPKDGVVEVGAHIQTISRMNAITQFYNPMGTPVATAKGTSSFYLTHGNNKVYYQEVVKMVVTLTSTTPSASTGALMGAIQQADAILIVESNNAGSGPGIETVKCHFVAVYVPKSTPVVNAEAAEERVLHKECSEVSQSQLNYQETKDHTSSAAYRCPNIGIVEGNKLRVRQVVEFAPKPNNPAGCLDLHKKKVQSARINGIVSVNQADGTTLSSVDSLVVLEEKPGTGGFKPRVCEYPKQASKPHYVTGSQTNCKTTQHRYIDFIIPSILGVDLRTTAPQNTIFDITELYEMASRVESALLQIEVKYREKQTTDLKGTLKNLKVKDLLKIGNEKVEYADTNLVLICQTSPFTSTSSGSELSWSTKPSSVQVPAQ
jgi:hypothetical protein